MESLKIIVLGYIVRGPLGGMVTSNLQYLHGLMSLGHDVAFVEIGDAYASCYDPSIQAMTTDPGYGLAFASNALSRINLGERWAYFDPTSSSWLGPAAQCMHETINSADLVLNLCGMNPLSPWFDEVPVRVLIDQDPAFTQIKHISSPDQLAKALNHTHFYSFGELLCRGDSRIPSDGIPWKSTRPPICLELWRNPAHPQNPPRFTSVMQWKSYQRCQHKGITYGMKDKSFMEFLDLPQGLPHGILEMAIAGAGNDLLASIQAAGWKVVDPAPVSTSPESYQQYIWSSSAELGIAKHGYVIGRTGWFSERSACYLASGRPVIGQDTGFSECLPCGLGLLSFTSLAEAASAIDEVLSDPEKHQKAAYEIAADSFDSHKVLSTLMDDIYSYG
jgi:hypothetical protein